MKAYRAILIPLPRECDARYIQRLMALANLAYHGYAVTIPDLLRYVQHQLLSCWQRFKQSLAFGTAPKRWLARAWVPLKTYRVFPEGRRIGDKSAPVALDFARGVVRVRQVCHNRPRYVVELPMPEWALERVTEGADIKFAAVGLKNGRPHLVLAAEREVQPIQPGDYALVVDVNSWRHGIAWALVRAGKVVSMKQERLCLDGLYRELLRLERKYGALRRLGLHETPEGKRLRREIGHKKRKLHAIVKDRAQWLAAKLAGKALKYRAKVVIDDVLEESRRGLLEERLPRGLAKIYLSGVRRFVRLLANQLQWYGIPFEFRRLYSTVCPRCGGRMRELPGRIVRCESCGLSMHRDLVPVMWYLKANGLPLTPA
ncbi:MAG: transposase [Thermoproteaceae archaeon]|nr:transposase [Thermoproteaceae archaeon]